MLIIGLTGSISTGKSTVSTILSSPPHNLPIVDADLIARQVVEPGTKGHAAIAAYFGPSTPDLLLADGNLNRVVLGNRVFGTDAARQQDRRVLNGIVHPLVQREIYKAITKNYLHGHWACILDIPLLFESSLDILCGTVLVVAVSSRNVQLARLLARDISLTHQDAERRVLSQMLIEEKMQRAERIYGGVRGRGHVLLNDGSVEELRECVGDMMEGVRSGRDGWWKWTLLVVPPLAGAVAGGVVVMNWWWRRRWVKERERERARL